MDSVISAESTGFYESLRTEGHATEVGRGNWEGTWKQKTKTALTRVSSEPTNKIHHVKHINMLQ